MFLYLLAKSLSMISRVKQKFAELSKLKDPSKSKSYFSYLNLEPSLLIDLPYVLLLIWSDYQLWGSAMQVGTNSYSFLYRLSTLCCVIYCTFYRWKARSDELDLRDIQYCSHFIILSFKKFGQKKNLWNWFKVENLISPFTCLQTSLLGVFYIL